MRDSPLMQPSSSAVPSRSVSPCDARIVCASGLLHSRRGELLGGAVDWMIALVTTAFVMIMLLILVSSYRSQSFVDYDLEHEVHLQKLYYSPFILNKADTSAKITETGVIDLSLFTEAHLQKNNRYLDQEKASIGAKLTIYDAQHRPLVPTAVSANPIYQNRQIYDSLKDFARAGVKGAGGATMHEQLFPIVYEDPATPGKRLRGYLEISTVEANS